MIIHDITRLIVLLIEKPRTVSMRGFSLYTDTFPAVFFFAVFAAVNFFFRIGKEKGMCQPLLNRRNAAGIFAFDDIDKLFGKLQHLFLDNR